MLKLLIVPINLIFFVGLTTFLSSDLEIQQDAPDRIPTQGNCEVTLTVKKGEVSGFAKLQHAFPEGIEVEALETAGATFTFSDQKMKWIWMALPAEESFQIKYKLTVTDAAITEVELGGAFSFLEENNRKSYFIQSKMLQVGAAPVEEVKVPVVATKRTVTDEGNGNYLVQIDLTRENVVGFAKVQEFIPEGATATSVNEKESVFSVVNNKVKFVWMNLPTEDQFSVSYRINMNGGTLDESSLTGEFAYVHDGQTMKASILAEGMQLAENSIETTETNIEDEPENTETTSETALIQDEAPSPQVEEEIVLAAVTPSNEEPEEEASEPVVNETEETEPTPVKPTTREVAPSKKITTVPVANTGINYRVQLIAGHNNVDQAYFASQFSYSGSFIVENHEGWMKYTTGDYPIYGDARNGREDIKSSYAFPGPFVVAYNNGERITVQEALMITNQKWVQ
jgi:hypothetical protein